MQGQAQRHRSMIRLGVDSLAVAAALFLYFSLHNKYKSYASRNAIFDNWPLFLYNSDSLYITSDK